MSYEKEEFDKILHKIAKISEMKRERNEIYDDFVNDIENPTLFKSIMWETFEMTEDKTLKFYYKVELPFEVKPVKHEKHPGCLMLYAGDEIKHETVVEGYVTRKALLEWISKDEDECFNQKPTIFRDTFYINYKSTKITFIPVVEFEFSDYPFSIPSISAIICESLPWFTVVRSVLPFNERAFMVSAPNWENLLINLGPVYAKAFEIMKLLCLKFNLSKVTDNMLKAIILPELPLKSKIDLDDFLLKMWKKLTQSLRNTQLSAFLMESFNLYRDLNWFDFEDLYSKASDVLKLLEESQSGEEDALKKLQDIEYGANCNSELEKSIME